MRGKKLTINEFIQRANNIYKNKYDYSKSIYINNKTKLIIICPLHGKFKQSPNDHLDYHKCPKCSDISRRYLQSSNTNEFISKAKLIHGDKYDYSKTIYVNALTKVKIICSKHGEFLQIPTTHLCNHGCYFCGRDETIESRKSNLESFLKQSTIIHGNLYEYSKSTYTKSNVKIEIICRTHGSFFQTPNNHLNGQGCPKCMASKGEVKIENLLKKFEIQFITEHKFNNCKNPETNRRLPFDFYIPSKNLLIEYDGEQHFGYGKCVNGRHITTKKEFEEMTFRDKIKTQYAKKNGIQLVRIKYTDFDKINVILSSILNA